MPTDRIADWKRPDYSNVYRQRKTRLEQLRADDTWSVALAYYADGHAAEWVEHWLLTYDPRNLNLGRSAWVPFILFPKQRHLVAWLQDRYERREHGLIEKSRDVGLSWVSLAFALWLWCFEPGAKVSFGSRKESLVDTLGNPDSLLERARMMLRTLPKELRPAGYVEREHARFMKIMNPANGAILTGEAGDNIGRGGRSSIYFLDEAAFIERPDAVEAALSQNTEVRIDISTPNGTGNPFYRRRMGGNVPVFTFHWSDDPRKDSAWYDQQKRTLEPEVLAQEVDLDYEASAGDTVVSAKWVVASRMLRKHLEREALLAAPEEGTAGLDVGAGTAKSVFVPRWGPVVGKSAAWTDDDTTNTAGRARDLALAEACPVLKFDAIGVGRGVAAALRRMPGVKAEGINVGERPTLTRWEDGKVARTKFANLKAELWWVVRDRLRRTYEHWLHIEGQGGQRHELAELLLLPDDADLCGQLALPRYSHTEGGKIQIESKRQLHSRGVPSPDHADALVLSFAPPPVRVHFGRTTGWW